MKYLLAVFIIGVLLGIMAFSSPASTGAATFDCYYENDLCDCGTEECVCGETVMPADYCASSLNQALK